MRLNPGEMQVTIADLGEFGLIAAITARFPQGVGVMLGPGDDAAVVAAPDGRVVATTDLLLEGTHFRRDWSAPADIGVKAAARSLADVAAMGAEPSALLVGFAAPGDLPVAWAAEVAGGIAAECARAGATVAGGDVASAGKVMLAVTALGNLAGRDPVTRAGARPGDMLAVTGALGASAAGLALLEAGRTAPVPLIEAHRRPSPRYLAGPQAAVHGATSMIDISDGLVADLGHVAAASGVCVSVETAALPVPDVLRVAAAELGVAGPETWVLSGGEDHAFAATFPPGVTVPDGWAVVGAVLDGHGVTVDGEPFGGHGGWAHFRE